MGLFNEKIYNEYENLRYDARKEILEQAEEIAEDILTHIRNILAVFPMLF